MLLTFVVYFSQLVGLQKHYATSVAFEAVTGCSVVGLSNLKWTEFGHRQGKAVPKLRSRCYVFATRSSASV